MGRPYTIDRNKANFLLVYETNNFEGDEIETTFEKSLPLYLAKSLQPSFNRAIIINESATGDGGWTYDNGRVNISQTVNGTLLATNNDELMKYERELFKLQGKEVKLVAKKGFSSKILSNKWYIESFSPEYETMSDVAMNFTMVLQEVRSTNVVISSQEPQNLAMSTELRALIKASTGLLEAQKTFDETKLLDVNSQAVFTGEISATSRDIDGIGLSYTVVEGVVPDKELNLFQVQSFDSDEDFVPPLPDGFEQVDVGGLD